VNVTDLPYRVLTVSKSPLTSCIEVVPVFELLSLLVKCGTVQI
jgi:hypothetical protein